MKKILIYTANTGGGHKACAQALKQEFEKFHYEVVIIDFLKEINNALDSFIINFNKIVTNRLPYLYGNLYYGFDNELNHKYFTSLFVKVARTKIYNSIILENPDLIIGSHSFLNGVMGYLKEEALIDIPYISLITDYKPHQNHINKNIDGFITASSDITEEFINRGISADRVFPYGIPIKEEFSYSYEKKDSNGVFQILLMGGSLGLKNMKKTLDYLSNIDRDIHIIVVCGTNIRLKDYFDKNYKEFISTGKITVYGYVLDMANLMFNSDVLITKPGGITITEAITINLPLIIPYYIPGQEKENLKYLIDKNVAIYIKDQGQLNTVIGELMDYPYILEQMKQNMRMIKNHHSIEDIILLCENLIEKYTGGD